MYLYLILILFFCSACDATERQAAQVLKVSDGDTIVVELPSHQLLRVRLIGVDAPESSQEPWGNRARAFVEAELKPPSPIIIEFGLDREDKYSRLLGYIYYRKNNKEYFLNSELLKNGWAEIFIFDRNDKHNPILKESQAQAQSLHLNIWQSNGLEMSPQAYRRKHRKR